MITLSAVMSRLRAELGLGPDDYVPDELVTEAITEHLLDRQDPGEPSGSTAPGEDPGVPLAR